MKLTTEAFQAIESGLVTIDSTRIGVSGTFEGTKRFASAQQSISNVVSAELFLSSLPLLLLFLLLSCYLDGTHSFSKPSFSEHSFAGLVTSLQKQPHYHKTHSFKHHYYMEHSLNTLK